jgi:hypothetical protein
MLRDSASVRYSFGTSDTQQALATPLSRYGY